MAWPNSCRHTENTQSTVTTMKHSMVLPGGYHHVVLFALAQQEMFAEEHIARGKAPLEGGFADVVHVNAAAFDILSGLAFGWTQTGMNQQFNEGKTGAAQL